MKRHIIMAFLFALLSTSLLFGEPYKPAGSGTENDPYQIDGTSGLLWLSQSDSAWDAYYKQTADINASDSKTWHNDSGFVPIGNGAIAFTGVYDGGGYVIDSLVINRSTTENVAFFGVIDGAVIKKLGLTNLDIKGGKATGGLVGSSSGNIEIISCYTAGTVAGTNESGYSNAGGLIGKCNGGIVIVDSCHSKANVSGRSNVGGLIGYINSDSLSTISTSFAAGSVTSGKSVVGGFIGLYEGGTAGRLVIDCYSNGDVNGEGLAGGFMGSSQTLTINRCYSTSSVTGDGWSDFSGVGGFIGYARWWYTTVTNCYSSGDVVLDAGSKVNSFGGFIGVSRNNVIKYSYSASKMVNVDSTSKGFIGASLEGDVFTSNFYDKEASLQPDSTSGAIGKTTAEMQVDSTFTNAGWNFTNIWEINNVNYPTLQGYVIEDNDPPSPDPLNFDVPPHAINDNQIAMTAETATDASGSVEYLFECVNDPAASSSWQSSETYTAAGLVADSVYIFKVKARDLSGNETGASTEISAATDYINKELVYEEVDGKCVMEAENANVIANGDFSHPGWGIEEKIQMRWKADTVGGGYAGTGYMTTIDGISDNATWEKATELSWVVMIANAGKYYIAVRRNSNGDGANDSAKPGVDGEEKVESTFWGEVTEFTWAIDTLGTISAGKHTIQIRRREDGFMLDRVMIASNLDSLPAEGSTEIGPQESAPYVDLEKPAGSGTNEDPYRVTCIENLKWMGEHVEAWGANYVQMNDIDASVTKDWNDGLGFLPIGDNHQTDGVWYDFKGVYDGGDHVIDSLNIYRKDSDIIGLFGSSQGNGGTIKNLGLTNVTIRGGDKVGGLVGKSRNSFVIENCYVTGKIKGGSMVGGLVGELYNGSHIENCYTKDGVVDGGGSGIGGFVGKMRWHGTVSNSYSLMDVDCYAADYIGGFAGWMRDPVTAADRCYSKNNIVTKTGRFAGGFTGVNQSSSKTTNCYSLSSVSATASAGGFCGYSDNDTIINCFSANKLANDGFAKIYTNGYYEANFFDTELSGAQSGEAAAGKTTQEMKTLATYTGAGWDFTDVWEIFGNNYPALKGLYFPEDSDELPLPENGVELIVNNYFNEGLDNWGMFTKGGSSLELDGNSVLDGRYSAHVRIDSLYEPYESGGWRVQLKQNIEKVGVKAGKKYYVQFQVKASKEITTGADGKGFAYTVVQRHDDWDPLSGCYEAVSIPANETVTVIDTFECSVDDSLVMFSFNLGNVNVDSIDIWIDAVHLMELDIADAIEKDGSKTPIRFELGDNYPNPFNPTTTITYSIPKASSVEIYVYNLLGQRVAELTNSKMEAGRHKIKFDASHLSSGLYFYSIKAGEFNATKKMLLIK